MLKTLTVILDIQELDMKMLRLLRLKKERQKELENIRAIKENLQEQFALKEEEIFELKKNIRLCEGEVNEVLAEIKKLQAKQNAVKKVEEYNALTHEAAALDRDRAAKEQRLSDMMDKQIAEEDLLKQLKESLASTEENSRALIEEIKESIERINEEGQGLKEARDALVGKADHEVFKVYERLLRNKRDRVVVPIENRCCSGCHIMLTAQDENLVRKGERLVFCEHCSRIHYWQESEVLEGSAAAPKPRRRRAAKAS
jgi:predicted  nucleic acid-binding Zn-ribbon protein